MNDLDLKVNQDFDTRRLLNGRKLYGDHRYIWTAKGCETARKREEILIRFRICEGQDAFNPLKGSIPARVDADVSKYDEYGKSAMKAFKESKLAPSLAHGSAAEEGFVTKANQAVNIFVTQKDSSRQFVSIIKRCNEIKTKEAAARHRLFLERSAVSCA